MTRIFGKNLVFSTFLLVIIAIGCAGSNNTPSKDTIVQTDKGGHDVNVTDKGPADPGMTDQGNPDACACTEKNECCDGCHLINEGGDCGDFKLCLTKGVCNSGVCTGGGEPKACGAPGECQTGTGTCNTETGKCEYTSAPDGQTCKAKTDIDGSGICNNGKCFGFDTCDHSVYDQPANYPCNFDSECESGICMALNDGWTKYCTQECGLDMDACPKDMFCVNGGKDKGRFCRPLNRDVIGPKDSSQPVYAPCNDDKDCKGGLCLALDKTNFCSANCESADKKADNKLCGDCGDCRDNGDKLGFKFKFYCSPKGKRKSGEPCRWSADCMHRYCMQGLCSEQCLDFNGKSNCPDNMECVGGVLDDPTVMVCVPKAVAGRGFGEECTGDYACMDGRKCIEIAGKKICTTDCSEKDATCPQGECTQYASKKKACLPKDWLGIKTDGEKCKAGFQCAEGLVCDRGACLKGCQKDDDCGVGTCFADLIKQVGYCVTGCETERNCKSGMTCFDGECVLNSDAQVYINGLCRTDADCVTGLCKGGFCTDTCKTDSDCEGSTDVQPGSLALCQPCDPNKFGTDCKDSYGFNDCVQDMEGKYFCATQCGFTGVGICPVGTRCYSINSSSVCAPISGSCAMHTACGSDGTCTKPAAPIMPCTEDADCGNGKCKDGRCDGIACVKDEDCGCSMLVCDSGLCEPSTNAGLDEKEPNNSVKDAQTMETKTQLILASLYSQDKPDKDYFSLSLKAGDYLDIWTQPFCGQYADTKLRLLNTDGTPIENWVSDDIAGQKYPFSMLMEFVADADRDIIIEVSQGQYALGVERVNYMMGINVYQPAVNTTCDQAVPLAADGEPHAYDLGKATNTMSAPSCTGSNAPGKDMAFAVTIPANNYMLVDAQTPFDSQLYLLSSCIEPDKNCVAGVDDYWKPAPEKLLFANQGSTKKDLQLIIDSFLPMVDMNFNISVSTNTIPFVDNDDVAHAKALDSTQGTIKGNDTGAANNYAAGADTCVKAELPGRDMVYSLTLQPGETLTLTLKDFAGVYPVMWLTIDPTDTKGCLAVTQGKLTYKNEGTTAQKAFLVIDSVITDGYSIFTIDYQISTPTRGFYTSKQTFSTSNQSFYGHKNHNNESRFNIRPGL